MNRSTGTRLFLEMQARLHAAQAARSPAATRTPVPPPRQPLAVPPVVRTTASKPPFDPSGDARPTTVQVHGYSATSHGDEQWARCCDTVHAAGMIRCGFRPLNVAMVDVSKPADVGLAYLDLGPFFTRHLSKMG